MNDAEELRRCRECGTVFEPDVADRALSGEPRCPQCFLSSSDEVLEVDQRELVIRQSSPFR
jgi:predicted  nucleic acid-binding Zn-ribbon protein